MKIGVLTFQHQLNYGGVLQAFALRWQLLQWGYDVAFGREVMTVRKGAWNCVCAKAKWLLAVLMRGEDFGVSIRERRTERFIAENLPEVDLTVHAVDAVIVGSDQVWNTRMLGERAARYFPAKEALCRKRRLISYAASLGMERIGPGDERFFMDGMPAFDAVSVRERSSIPLLSPYYKGQIVHVCDPTLFLSAEDWTRALDLPSNARVQNRVFVYALDLSSSFLRELVRYSVRNHISVYVYTDPWLTTMPRTPISFFRFKCLQMRVLFSRVRIVRSAGPKEFVQAIRSAKHVFADSFHALMFATIFRRPARLVIDQLNDHRVRMGARIVEFVKNYWTEGAVSSSWREALDGDKFSRVLDDSALHQFVEASRSWFLHGLTGSQGE